MSVAASRNTFWLTAIVGLEVDRKIVGFQTGSPFTKPSEEVVESALFWARALREMGFDNLDAFPGHYGEILVSGLQDNECFEVTVEPDLRLHVSFERGDAQVFFLERVSATEVARELTAAVRNKWISSVGYIQSNSTNGLIGSQALPLRTAQTPVEACP